MKLAYVELCGFRGYRKPLRIDFAERFTIIDGRNGVGKSTVFDAIEFALTGKIGKYGDAKAAGESVADYIWWTGEGPAPKDHFVEVGFTDSIETISIRRTRFGEPDAEKLKKLSNKLCDPHLSPQYPITQLCASSIIRDEHIASLSLDLKETDRYTLLRDALGANDAADWITRASQLRALIKRRVETAQEEVTALNNEVSTASRRIDQVRATLVKEETMAAVVERLRTFLDGQFAPDQLAGPTRQRITEATAEIETLDALCSHWNTVGVERLKIPVLAQAVEKASRERETAIAHLQSLATDPESASASELAAEARDLIELVTLGRKFGLRDGHCPLCDQGQSDNQFDHGVALAEALAHRLDEQAAKEAEREQTRRTAKLALGNTELAVEQTSSAYKTTADSVAQFDRKKLEVGFDDRSTLDHLSQHLAELQEKVDSAQKDLRLLETLRFSGQLERAQREEADAKKRLALAQKHFGRARQAESLAQALHDAARRAASETLDRRLDRVLPLMLELYNRLRPHPVWRDIEYSIRGDVRRFLKLQVGENLNPQFLFSSGQRRATGLAFLLSVNLSLTWSRWRSILLDDPVQHVDDFRAVHLAEVTAQLVAEGRQVICAVEDAALADLFCRRLPINQPGEAKRLTLGPDEDGALVKLSERELPPLIARSLLVPGEQTITG